jgi:uncharacterized glyoxalase superfamily protein PhnB
MKQTPKGWPRLTSAVFYQDAAAAIDWLCRVIGFQIRLKIDGENGAIVHSELEYGDALIMVSGESKDKRHARQASPRGCGGLNTQSIMLFVDDVDAHCAHARAEGAKIVVEPKTEDYGEDYWADRCYQLEDPEGHLWWFAHRVRG